MPCIVNAESLAQKLSGQILLNVQGNGEAWYIYPEDNKRYYLGRPADAFQIMRELGLGITEIDFQRIAQSGMPVAGDLDLAKRLAGKIILQVEKNGEAWYIYPKDLKKYYLGRPADAFQIMRELSLGITRENLAKIHKPGLEESLGKYSKYEHKIISTIDGDFKVDIVTIDLSNPNLQIITDTAAPSPNPSPADAGEGSYGAQSLAGFIIDNNGFAGINGTYFCCYNNCGGQNYYFYPVYNSNTGAMINKDQLKYWTTGPIMAFDANNKFYYFKDSRDFKSAEHFETVNGIKLQAAIGNKPRLIEDGMNLLIEWDIDEKQRAVKSLRNAMAYKNGSANNGTGIIYLVIAHNATVPNLANIMKAMEVEYAINLDGGYSSALWYNDEYMVGPGRDVPNAVIFCEK
ncbi:phosphodiester glycosidase family protein [Candidatus Parcubacteria bacterium]|nr:phosphodiester glycosidase family protein [Candidatus Parcubacteria bacterium]